MSEIEHVVRTEVGSVCEVISVRPERTATPILNLVNFKARERSNPRTVPRA
jgi:hypothetical protein